MLEAVQQSAACSTCDGEGFTLLANAEKLVCVPSHDTTGQSSPAPFHDAAQRLHWLVPRNTRA